MSKTLTVRLVEARQPIGVFYVTVLPAEIVLQICEISPRKYDPHSMTSGGGVQRKLSPARVSDIAAYTEDSDATFPTPIIIAVYTDAKYTLHGDSLTISPENKLGEVIDGQHRLEGLKASKKASEFDLPVILMFDLTTEEKAYVFSIINSKQMSVNKSLIYELFDLFEDRSPQKTTHEIARLLNSDEASPYYQRLKMLGRKEHADASLSQGSFAKYFIGHLSKDPDSDLRKLKQKQSIAEDPSLPLRTYFIREEDEVIYKVVFNYLSAVRDVFPNEWTDSKGHILSKTTGFGALMIALYPLCLAGKQHGHLNYEFFRSEVGKFAQNLSKRNLRLTSQDFPSNEAEQKKLADVFLGRF